jgi:7-keto-8-aminopelargonate synthetase-like enzyme
MTDSLAFSFESPLGPRVRIAGRERDYFSGTGYLGLHNHPAIQEAAITTIRHWGMSTATSRGGYGEHPVYTHLEEQARAFFAAEAVLYYPSGYLSALILAQGLRDRYERAFVDESSHYSVMDGLRAAGNPVHAFHHLDPQSLKETLRGCLQPGERPLVFSEGLFPISAEIAPLPAYLSILEAYPGSLLALDDAHAAGVLGPHGRGVLEHYGLNDRRCFAGATLSKALGGYGGVLPLAAVERDKILGAAKAYLGSSPPPLPTAAAAAAGLQIARSEPQRLETLRRNVKQARDGLRALGWELENSPVPILCLRARASLDLGRIKAELFARDICLAHVTGYSSTPPGGCLRLAVFATHTSAQIERLVDQMRAVL